MVGSPHRRVGAMRHRVQVMKPGSIILDPDSGGLIPGPPVLAFTMACAIEPGTLESMQETLTGEGQVLAVHTFIVTNHHQPQLAETMLIDFWDQALKRTRRLEIATVRDVEQAGRYQESLCKERIGEPVP
jgi:hypothetical protein